MAEPWGYKKVIEIIMDSAKEGLVDLTDTEQLIKISYHYGVIDGFAIADYDAREERK